MKNRWNPEVLCIPHKIKTHENNFNLEQIASLVYDRLCQFQVVKSKSGHSLSIELQEDLTRSKVLLERTGSDG